MYDPLTGKPSVITDYHNHSKQYTYNSNGFITSFTDAKGKAVVVNYYPNNINIQSVENGPGTLTYTYNDAHDITSIIDGLNNKTTLTYNTYGQITAITEAQGTSIQMTTEFVYAPEANNLFEIRRNGNILSSYTHDNIGRVKTHNNVRDLMFTYDYNNLDQITGISYPDGKSEIFNYSTCCPRLIESRTDRAGLVTYYTYDELKRLIRVQGPEDTVSYEYDANGNISKLTDENNAATSFEYNLDNKLMRKIYPNAKLITYSYDITGLLITITNSRGIEKNYSYDDNHNLLGVNYSDNTPSFTFTYDDYNRVITRSDGTGFYQYSYDVNNRLTGIDGPWEDDTITFQYNELGQMETLIVQKGQGISYMYDTSGRLTDIQSGIGTFTYEYTGADPLEQKMTRPDGSFTEYLYNDPLKRITEIVNKGSSGETINKNTFAYNTLDLIETEELTNGESITSFQEGVTIYDYNNLNQLLSSTNPDRMYLYDNDGNIIKGYTPNGYVMNMNYDAENRLNSIEYTDAENIIHKTEFFYSGDSLLAEAKKYENSTMVSSDRYLRNGFLVLQERNADNNVVREYTWGIDIGGGIGGLLNLKQDGTDYSYLYDGRGNVIALLDNLQNVVGSYRYDAFGDLMIKNGNVDQPYMFSTKRYDEAAGLSYYGYRFYNSSIGRWMTRDPLGELGGINMYEFSSLWNI
jgi:RHS repeat-associated protein